VAAGLGEEGNVVGCCEFDLEELMLGLKEDSRQETNNGADVCLRGYVHYCCWRREGCIAPASGVLFECFIRWEVDGCFL